MSDDYNKLTGYKGPLDRRDRLDHALCADEPSDPVYQPVLEAAYIVKQDKHRRLAEVYGLLEQNKHQAMSSYQRVRTEYLIAEYYMEVDAELDARRVPDSERADDPIGRAADHYRRAADIAKAIPDHGQVLFVQLKHLERRACYFSHPYRRRYRRAFAAAKEALNTWLLLPPRKLTDDMQFAFNLGDALGVCGQMVAEDAEAVRGLDYAAQMLHELRDRPDYDVAQYANDDLFLDWNWADLYYTMGFHRHAFRKARATRKKGRDLFTVQNRARFQRLVANIVLACAVEGKVEDYSRARLLAAGERAIDEGYTCLAAFEKEDTGSAASRAEYAMLLLSEAKWMGLSRKKDGRIEKIEEAQAIAKSRADPLLLGQVEIAWGREVVFQYLSRPAKRKAAAAEAHFREAIEILTDVEALSVARLAQRRLDQLLSMLSGQSRNV